MRALLTPPGQETHEVDPDDLDEIDRLFFDPSEAERDSRRGREEPPVVALIGSKGGTGKTSIAVMLAGNLTTQRRRAGVLDLDPRGGIGRWSKAGRGLPFPTYTCDADKDPAAFDHAFRRAKADLDLIVVDTPPRLGPASRLALEVADLALIPAGASSLDLAAVEEAVEVAEDTRQARAGKRPRVKVVPSRQDARTRLAREFGGRLKALGVPVAPAIGQRVEVAAAADAGRLVRAGTMAGKEFKRLSKHVLSSLRSLGG